MQIAIVLSLKFIVLLSTGSPSHYKDCINIPCTTTAVRSGYDKEEIKKGKGIWKLVERREARIKSLECEILNKLGEIMQAEIVLS